MADGFLGRWSRRKLDVKEGRPVEADPPAPAPAKVAAPAPAAVPAAVPGAESRAEAAPAPPPTLDDVASLTPESDFTRFVAADVTPEVKNAAMKKLFADPHFNVMDGLDIYIDDYGKPDPIPTRMLESLASAEFLGLFREDNRGEGEAAAPAAPAAHPVAPAAVPAPAPAVSDPPATDADPDLRLQQDPAPGPQGPGDGAR
ncbi:DUF3306 domain-containing protein [Ramlibacter sp. MAHUQ-53]|uniref:DUF3306 domain-containing protein n=1 Tax=unclassified Ramlibacter TaxID=2617605 RepID=UPI00363ADE93